MKSAIINVFLVGAYLLLCGSAQAVDPVERTNDLVKAFKAVKPVPATGEKLSEADRKANLAAFARLDEFFDFERLTNDPLDTNKQKFNPGKLTQFTNNFRDLIRLVAYPSAGDFMSRASLNFKAGKRTATSADVEMHAKIKKEDIETTVTFHWRDSGKGFRVVDVSFDGASLVKDYRNQFSKIIQKDGVNGLTAKLDKRLEKERQQNIITP